MTTREPTAIATITLAKSRAEQEHLLDCLRSLSNLKFPTFVCDRTEDAAFTEALSGLGLRIVSGGTNLVAQTQNAMKAAKSAAKFVLYTEPDKKGFFEKHLESFAATAKTDTVVFPSRSKNSFVTYSRIQQREEEAINQLCGSAFGCEGDYTYGPLLLPSAAVDHMDSVPAHVGWGWRMHLLRAAAKKGFEFAFSEMDLPCPPGQERDTAEEWLHRMRQFSQNLNSLLDGSPPKAELTKLFPTFDEFPPE